jgi:uncharacterized protein YjbI with pentapeptide repeats
MANPEHIGKLNEGVKAWNQWRADRAIHVDLSGAEFSGKDLTGADLRDANLENARLRNAKLGLGTLLWNANLCGTDLYQADLGGADLQDVNFTGADLFEAKLREANLQGADLSCAKGGLKTEQLAGSNLRGAKLPEQLMKFYDGLENVKNISESARKLFVAIFATCLYSWLAIASTTDLNLITNRASSPLPIIQTSIPIAGFYMVTPLILLCVYFYFHFYLQKLWEELGALPAVFTDGRPLHTKIDPWLLNDLVRAHLPKLNVNRPFMSYFQLWISVLLAWWVAPITICCFWGRYLMRHRENGTTLHVVLLAVSLVSAVCLYRLAVPTLRGVERNPFTWKRAVTSPRAYLTSALSVAVGVSWAAMAGVRPSDDEYWENTYRFRTWVPRSLAIIGCPPFANLNGAEVSLKKPGWSEKNTKDVDFVMGAQLFGTDLRYALAEGAFLDYANLTRARLRGAHLTRAYLRGAYLVFADLSETDLTEADLRNAHMRFANLNGAHYPDTDLSGADLRDAKGLEPDEVMMALNWKQAFYDQTTLDALGLPSDHNKKVAAELGVEEPSDVKVIH